LGLKKFGVAELRYELPSPQPLSPRERARVRVNLAIHTRIQQRQKFEFGWI
jgi:hypothetical protein